MYFHPSSFIGWFKSSCSKTDLLDVRRWRGRDHLDPGAGVRHEEHGHEPHRGRAPRDDQRVRHRRLRTGAQYTTHFSSVCPPITNIFYRLNYFCLTRSSFPSFATWWRARWVITTMRRPSGESSFLAGKLLFLSNFLLEHLHWHFLIYSQVSRFLQWFLERV